MEYWQRFQRVLIENKKKGRDHQVVCEYLRIRDELVREGYKDKKLHDGVFSELEKKFL